MPGNEEAVRAILSRTGTLLVRLSFPAALLLLGTFFLGGRIGFWSDDYWHNLRNPATGELPEISFRGLTMDRGFFLRPLFYMVAPAVTTLAWKTQWPAHLAMTLVHGLVVAYLWRLMRLLGVSPRASAAAALLYMVYPGHFEAVFWTAALPTTIATALMLRLMIVYVWYARRERPFQDGRGWWAVAAMPVLVFEVCCLNEQPAMGVLAMPLVYWAARGGGVTSSGRGRVVECRRALVPAFVCGVAVLAYAALVVFDPNKPAGSRGSAEQFVTLGQLPARAVYFGDVLWRRLVLKNFWRGALGMGWDQWWAAGIGGAIAAGLVLTQSVLWLRRWMRSEETGPDQRPRVGRVALAGGVVFVTGFLPILMMAVYEPDSRTRYWPAVGLAMSLGAGMTWLERAVSGRVWRVVSGAAFIAVVLVFATMQIGIQSAFRQRWRMDSAQGAELRALVPRPAPYAFFVPLNIAGTGVRTGSPVFDAEFRSVWEFPWTTWKFIEGVYRRDDVRAGYWRHWTPGVPVAGAGEGGLLYVERLGPRFPMERGVGWRIPWERCVPFVIDEAGRVHGVTGVVAETPGAASRRYTIPAFQTPVENGRLPARTVTLPAR